MKTFIELISFEVKHPIPKEDCPYGFRKGSHPFVPALVRNWRKAIADAFLAAGGRKPEEGEKPRVFMVFTAEAKRTDGDHLLHALMDALTKDALSISDNKWTASYDFDDEDAPNPFAEKTLIEVQYTKKEVA